MAVPTQKRLKKGKMKQRGPSCKIQNKVLCSDAVCQETQKLKADQPGHHQSSKTVYVARLNAAGSKIVSRCLKRHNSSAWLEQSNTHVYVFDIADMTK